MPTNLVVAVTNYFSVTNSISYTNSVALDSFTLLKHVDEFYATSWAHLLTIITIALSILAITVTIFSIIIPMIQRKEQKRSFSENVEKAVADLQKEFRGAIASEHDSNTQILSASIDAMKKEFKEAIDSEHQSNSKIISTGIDEMKREIKQELDDTRNQMAKDMAGMEGGTFHVQALLMADKGAYIVAMTSMLDAANQYSQSNDEANFQKALTIISANYFSKLNKKDLDENAAIKEKYDTLVATLSRLNANGRYTNSLDSLRRAMKLASERIQQAPVPAGISALAPKK